MFELISHYKVTFSQEEHVQILTFSLAKYQRDVENYMDQVLNFLLFDRHEYIHTESSSL